MTHAVIAVAIQAMLIAVGLSPACGGIAAVAFYLGRELAQAEARIIAMRYGERRFMPWYGAFISDAWNKKSVMDVAYPVLAVVFVALIVEAVR